MDNSINFNTYTPQVNFTGKRNGVFKRLKYRRQSLKEQQVIDSVNDRAVQLINKDRSVDEQKETAIRKNLEWIFKHLGFGKKLRDAGKESSKKKQSSVAKSVEYLKDIKKCERNSAEFNHNEMEKHMAEIFKKLV